ncbi:MAG: ABC transporter permease [Candidatus Magasanikbacteria bacterium]|nr:ABC transporter permease [Candidatus Magasanikbacteria bacterium]
MNVRTTVQNAARQLVQYKMRSILTMLGIIIGITSVIVVMAVGAGAQSLLIGQITSVGSNLVAVLPGGSEENGPPAAAMGIVITTLKKADIDALRVPGIMPHLVASTGYVKGVDTARAGEKTEDVTYTGVEAQFSIVEDIRIGEGRFFDDTEDKTNARVIVLGSEVRRSLFNDSPAIGETVKLKKESFKVVGVMEPRGERAFQNYDTQVFVPLVTAQKLLLGINHVSLARFKIDSAEHVDESQELIKSVVRARHGIAKKEQDDFSVRSQLDTLRVFTTATNALKLFLTAIAALALVVGGIGIMNIMLIAVQERIKEIGLKKAVGATNRAIMQQFLIETIVMTIVAGAMGIILGALIAGIVALAARWLGYQWKYSISWNSIIAALGMSAAIGLIFGLYPARRASRLEPVEALRYE